MCVCRVVLARRRCSARWLMTDRDQFAAFDDLHLEIGVMARNGVGNLDELFAHGGETLVHRFQHESDEGLDLVVDGRNEAHG